jgi:hypothetical protein
MLPDNTDAVVPACKLHNRRFQLRLLKERGEWFGVGFANIKNWQKLMSVAICEHNGTVLTKDRAVWLVECVVVPVPVLESLFRRIVKMINRDLILG